MELDTEALFNGLVMLVITGIFGILRSMFNKIQDNRERLIRLEERARRKDESQHDHTGNGDGYLD